MNGTALRDEAIALVDYATPDQWKNEADSLIVSMARSGTEFTAEDVRAWVGDPPRPGAMGARFLAAIKRGLIQRVGVTNAKRKSSHACLMPVYRGAA